MILMWPCPTCKQLSTSPEGCLAHRPHRPEETFEEQLLRAMTTPLREGAVQVSGMTFPGGEK